MGGGRRSIVVAPSIAPISAAVNDVERQGHLSSFDSSVNAVSFGFVATAVLILMFLVMAIFERFLRPRSSATDGNSRDLEARMMAQGKLDYPSPKTEGYHKYKRISIMMSIYAKGVSVLMPGEEIPTFIAHPAPAPCPTECIISPPEPHHECSRFSGPSSSTHTS